VNSVENMIDCLVMLHTIGPKLKQ